MITIIKYKINQMLKRKRVYLLFLILILISAVYFRLKFTNYVAAYQISDFKGAGAIDILIYLFAGANKEFLIINSKLDFPINYLTFIIYLSVMIYLIYEGENDKTIVIKIGSKKRWLLVKIIISLINMLLYYFMVIIISIFVSKFNFNINKVALKNYLKMDSFNADLIDILRLLIIIFFTALAIIMIQTFLNIVLNGFVGIVGSLIIYILGIFKCNYFYIANGTMLSRSDLFLEMGLKFNFVLIADFIIIIVFFILSIFLLNKKDFL